MKAHSARVVRIAAAWIVFAFLAPAPPAAGHDTRDIRHRVADAYGVHSFNRVKRIDFTFNVRAGERHVRRSWTWWPLEGRVRYDGGTWRDGAIEYRTSDLSGSAGEDAVEADKRFINDSYWLLFPFHVEWDAAANVTDEGISPLPMGPEGATARRIVVAYPEVGGYTPGDVYELYVSEDYRVVQWVYRPGGSEEERHPATWEHDERFGRITICTDHRGPDDGFHLWFSDVRVEYRDE